MRLFRGKIHKKPAYIDKWVYGVPVFYEDNCCMMARSGYSFPVSAETVGEYTGLPDMNGTKIFEGDILRYIDPDTDEYTENEYYVVGYDTEQAMFITNYYENGSFVCIDTGWATSHTYMEVVGNIHDNPELLEVEE